MSSTTTAPKPRRLWPLGGIGFTGFFLIGQFAGEPLREGDLPVPDAPAATLVEFYSANTASSVVVGVSHILAALSLLFLVGRAATELRSGPGPRTGVVAGWVAAVALAVSGALSITLPLVASDAAPATVATLRDFNFWSGGVVHVVTLGLFVGLWCLNSTALGRGLRISGRILAVPAVLSVASLLWYYASVLLPVGRFTLMIWAVVAAVSLLRAGREEQPAS